MSHIYSSDLGRESSGGGRFGLPPAFTRAAGAVLFLALVISMAVWAYHLGTRDVAEVPIIRAMEGPARLQPEEPGGLKAAHQGLEVNTVLGGLPAPVPSPDSASVATLSAPVLADEDGPQGALIGLETAAPLSAPEDGEALRMPPGEDIPATADASAAPGDNAAEVAAMIEAALAGDLAADSGVEEDLAAVAMAATPRPRTRPANLSRARAPATVTPAPPAAPAPAARAPVTTPAPLNTPAAAREVASVGAGSRLVQLGAFDSENLARQTWGQLTQRHGDLLGAKSLFLERVTHNARVFYRLRVAGFDSTDQTMRLCEQLRGRGVDCIPVTVN